MFNKYWLCFPLTIVVTVFLCLKGPGDQNFILQHQLGRKLNTSSFPAKLCPTTSYFQQMLSHRLPTILQNSSIQQMRPQLPTAKASNAPEHLAVFPLLLLLDNLSIWFCEQTLCRDGFPMIFFPSPMISSSLLGSFSPTIIHSQVFPISKRQYS